MNHTILLQVLLAATLVKTGCTNNEKNGVSPINCEQLQIRSEIETVIRQSNDYNKRKDIDGFMSAFDSTFVLESNEASDQSRLIVKDTLKKDILRDWGIIAKMYEVERWIDSIEVLLPDTAIVYTNQFYHRTFTKPNNLPGEDDVITTQKHRETWILRNDGWKQQRVKELGGAIYVNGLPYNESGN
jgi:hypothetical protein